MGSTTVTTTVVFTDLVGSTETAARLGPDGAEELRTAYFGLLRQAISASGGSEVKNLGDGLMVSYPNVVGALDGTVAIQQHVERHNRRASEPLGVRVGLSTGDATAEDGDFFGEPIVEAARLCARAHGGQILTTAVVQQLARRSSHDFKSLGSHELKGLPEPVEVCEVQWAPASQESQAAMPHRLAASPATGLVGRTEEVARLLAALEAVVDGQGHRMVLLAGEPGIGKTTLASHVAQAAHAAGATVLYGRSDDELGVPYQPFVEAIGSYLADISEATLHDIGLGRLEELSRLLPQVRARVPAIAAPRSTDPDAERYLFFGAVTAVLTHGAAMAPMVIVIDDLHWADKHTVLLLRHLATTLGPAEVLVIGTYRDTEVAGSHPLVDVLAALRRESTVERLDVKGLDTDGVRELLASLAGRDADAARAELAQVVQHETGGNPFFATELLRHLAGAGAIELEDGRWETKVSLSSVGIPASVREVVAQRIRGLGDQVHEVLNVASVIGRDFDLGLLARASEGSERDVLACLESAVAAQVVGEVVGAPGRFSFTHDLFNHALYDGLSASRRSLLHGSIAAMLEADCGGDPGDRVGELARHWLAVTAGGAGKAADYAQRAADRALASLAPDEAIRWYRHVVDLLGRPPDCDSPQHLDGLIGLGDAKRQAGDPSFRETLLDAAQRAARVGDGPRLITAVLVNQRGIVSGIGTFDPERIQLLELALVAVGDGDGRERAFLLATLAAELTFTGDLPRIRRLATEATDMARRLGDPAALLRVLNTTFLSQCVPDGFDRTLAASKEAVALSEVVRDPIARYWAWMNRFQAATSDLDREGFETATRQANALAEELGQPYLQSLVVVAECCQAMLAGDPDRAEVLANEAFRLGAESGQPDALVGFVTILAGIRAHQGRVDEMLPIIEQAASENAGFAAFDAAHATFLCEVGRFADAQALLDAARAVDFHRDVVDYTWLTHTTLWAETAAWLGDVAAAATLHERLAPFESQAVNTGVSFTGTVGLYLARLAAVLGRHDDAEELFRRTDARLRAVGAPFWAARNQVEWARMLLERGSGTDHEDAQALLADAARTAAKHGCAVIEARAMTLAGR